MRSMLWTFIVFFAFCSNGQEGSISNSKKAVIADVKPKYPGGRKALYDFLDGEIIYPHAAKNRGIEGRVYVEFEIAETGKMENLRIAKGLGHGLDREALRVFTKIPKNFIPGKKNGKPVRVKMIMPVHFMIYSDS